MSDLKLCETGWFSSSGDVFPGLGLGPLVKHVYVAQMLGVNADLWILKQNRWSSRRFPAEMTGRLRETSRRAGFPTLRPAELPPVSQLC